MTSVQKNTSATRFSQSNALSSVLEMRGGREGVCACVEEYGGVLVGVNAHAYAYVCCDCVATRVRISKKQTCTYPFHHPMG